MKSDNRREFGFSLLSREELEYMAKMWIELVLYNINVYFPEKPEYDEKMSCVEFDFALYRPV